MIIPKPLSSIFSGCPINLQIIQTPVPEQANRGCLTLKKLFLEQSTSCALKANTQTVPKLTLPHSLDWLNRENVQEPSIFHGENHGLLMVPVDFPLNQVIDKSESKTHWRSTCKARLSSSSAAKSLPGYEGHGELFSHNTPCIALQYQ